MINVDISNVWGQIALPDLLKLEAEVFAAHMALTEGSNVPGWLDLPNDETDRILSAAQKIRRDSDVLVVLGTGCLGARAAIELLQGSDRNFGRCKGDPQILFAGDSFSTRRWNELCRLLEGKDVSLCVISKSGADLEPSIALRSLKWMLERRYGTDEAAGRIYAVTDAAKGPLRQMAEQEGWTSFSIPENVSAPFSLLTPAGLLPMAAAGIDIQAVLRGASEAKQSYDLRSYENPVWLYASVRHLLYQNGKTVELLAAFEPAFRAMGAWLQQLFAFALDGKCIFPVSAQFPRDLYPLSRLLQGGSGTVFETLIRFDPPEKEMTIGTDVKDLDGINYLSDKPLSFVEEAAYQSAVTAHAEGGTPVITVDCGELNETALGELIWFFQLSSCLSALLLGADLTPRTGAEPYRCELFRQLGRPDPADL